MLKKDELANPDSCLNRSADDEPIFVLRANDPLAAKIVREWAFQYVTLKQKLEPSLTEKQRKKYREANELSAAMDRWNYAKNGGAIS